MYYAFAEHDRWVPLELVDQLRRALDANGIIHETEVLPATEHGFAFPRARRLSSRLPRSFGDKMFKLYARVLG